ncbi:lecithin-cholesterol acyltransferase-like 1 [Miscanthus floridulus]|uniref:lecithin-cholesterol acyltransferase-like 1 n=1 Tax=Miscanthus floridulus TaxID=154761 RepID=UPI003458103C
MLFFVDALSSSLHPVVLVPGNTCGQRDARRTDEYEPSTPGCGIRKQGARVVPAVGELHGAAGGPNAPAVPVLRGPAAASVRPRRPATTATCGASRLASWPSAPPSAFASTTLAERTSAWKGWWRHWKGWDFRYAPAAPGLVSRVFSDFLSSFRLLVERAS